MNLRGGNNPTNNITQTHVSTSHSHLLAQGEPGFHTLTNVLQDVTLHSKPHRAVYPTLERRIEKGHSATDVKPKLNASSGAVISRGLKNGQLWDKGPVPWSHR